jgi:hypothetical protein
LALRKDIAQERVALERAVSGSKLGQHIRTSYLDPILKSLDDSADQIMNKIGQRIVEKLQHRIMQSTPTGNVYKVVLVEGPRHYIQLGNYRASAKGQPPAIHTGSLVQGIKFISDGVGRIKVGIFEPSGFERMGTLFFRGRTIFVSPNAPRKPVNEYAPILDDPSSKAHRDWLHNPFSAMRKELRSIIQSEVKKAMRKTTRSKNLQKAIYFRVYFRG